MQIEKNIPIPVTRGSRSKTWAVLGEMEIGDSVVVEGELDAVRGSTYARASRLGRKFTVRKVADRQARIWRVS